MKRLFLILIAAILALSVSAPRRLFFVVLALVMMAVQAWASPFLTCDCYPSSANVQQFRVKVNALAWVNTPAVASCVGATSSNICTGGGVTMCWDLSGIPTGTNTIIADAQDPWGWSSDSLPFTLPRPAGGISSPTTLRYIIP